jgi:hypothetical protein
MTINRTGKVKFMNEYLDKDKIKKEILILGYTVKHLFVIAESSFSLTGEIKNLANKQILIEEILFEVKSGDSLEDKFILRELNYLLFELNETFDRVKSRFLIPLLAVNTLKYFNNN